MANLTFACTEAAAQRYAATPTLSFKLTITESTGVRVHAIALRCQIRIEPHRRRYSAAEARRLNDLFGDTSRWAETVKPIQFAMVSTMVPGFASLTEVDLPVPCTYDLEVASARYLQGLDDGTIPLVLLFSGTVFLAQGEGFSVELIPWSCEAAYRMPVTVWRDVVDAHFPGSAWLRCSRETLDALSEYKATHALPTWDATLAALLALSSPAGDPPVTPRMGGLRSPPYPLRPPGRDAVNTDVRRIADAVLYEGYILYPYRASAQKNRSRWQFGVLMPPVYTASDPYERPMTQAECVFEHAGRPSVEVTVRFLQVQRRVLEEPFDPAVPPVWDEAVEHEVTVMVPASGLLSEPSVTGFVIPGGEEHETLSGARVARRREPLAGSVSVRATPLDGPWQAARLTVLVTNQTQPAAVVGPMPREQALPSALVAAHMIITVSGGAFFSMTDPPEWAQPEVRACENVGCWPVLAGRRTPGRSCWPRRSSCPTTRKWPRKARGSCTTAPRSTRSSPCAPSPCPTRKRTRPAPPTRAPPRSSTVSTRWTRGPWRNCTAPSGPCARPPPRTPTPPSSTPPPPTRSPPPPTRSPPPDPAADPFTPAAGPGGARVPWWDPAADASVSPGTDAVTVAGQRIARGSRVTLRPGARRADAQDMFLAGRTAIVEAVLFDVDDTAYLAVSLADAPDADIQVAHGRFLYFAPDEVEPDEAGP